MAVIIIVIIRTIKLCMTCIATTFHNHSTIYDSREIYSKLRSKPKDNQQSKSSSLGSLAVTNHYFAAACFARLRLCIT